MPKWVPPLVGLFLLFVIYSAPDAAADFARGFGAFLGQFLSNVVQFLGSLFGGIEGSDSAVTNTVTTLPGDASGATVDFYDFGDHTGYHTHPVPTTAP